MNGRVLLVPSNGQGRVAAEINRRLNLTIIAPRPDMASGIRGHIWEQTVLPLRLHGAPLWSPSTSAPIAYRNQIVTVHDIGFVDAPQFFAPRFAATYSFIVRRVAKTARHIVTVSDFSRRRLLEEYGLSEDRVTTIHPGIAEAFSPQPHAAIEAVLARHGLSSVPYLIAFAGADPRKNTNGVLAAWASLADRRGGARLVLFGRASNASVFGASQAAVAETDVIRVGSVPDAELASLFSGSRGLVFPSLYEGFGLPVVEAAACGAPIVTSTVTSLPEVAPAGALLVDPVNTGEIAEAMATLLDTQPNAIDRARSADAMRRRFSWDAGAKAYRALFAATFA